MKRLGYGSLVELVYGQDPSLDMELGVKAVIEGEVFSYRVVVSPRGVVAYGELRAGDTLLLRAEYGKVGYLAKTGNMVRGG